MLIHSLHYGMSIKARDVDDKIASEASRVTNDRVPSQPTFLQFWVGLDHDMSQLASRGEVPSDISGTIQSHDKSTVRLWYHGRVFIV